MSCPLCNGELQYEDDRGIVSTVFRFFKRNMNPFSPVESIINLSKGMYQNVYKSIKYDFTSISKVHEFFWCPNCKTYFLQCPHCYHINWAGEKAIESPVKIRCVKCKKEFIYLSISDPDDGREPMYRYL